MLPASMVMRRGRTVRADDHVAALEQLRPDGAGVVRLHGQDAGRVTQVGLALDERRGAMVGRHSHVLEDEGAVQKDHVALRNHTQT